jgi:hypothetical protein
MVERFFNRVNVVRGVGFGILCLVVAVAAISSGGWQGWVIGAVFLVLAVYGFVGPVLRPRYRTPER